VGLGLRTVRGTSFCLIQLGPKTGEVEERWGDPTAAGRAGQERGRGDASEEASLLPHPPNTNRPSKKTYAL